MAWATYEPPGDVSHLESLEECTPLFIAALYDYVDVVKVLLEYNACPDHCMHLCVTFSSDVHELLNEALAKRKGSAPGSSEGKLTVDKLHDERDASTERKGVLTSAETTVSIATIEQGGMAAAAAMIRLEQAIWSRELILAANFGDLNKGSKLLNARIRARIRGDDSIDIALCQAAALGHDDFVELVLRYGADVDAHAYHDYPKFRGSATALFIAAHAGHVSVIKVLLKHKARLDVGDDNRTPLHVASNPVVVALLKAAGRKAELVAQRATGAAAMPRGSKRPHTDQLGEEVRPAKRRRIGA
jgi:ankyrin repeat protein